MKFHFNKYVVMLIAGLFYSAGLSAQPSDTLGWITIERVENTNVWLASENVAGLHILPAMKISNVEGYLDKGNGGFVNYNESPDYLKMGLLAESYYRLNPKIVFYGLMNYSNFAGKDMAGSSLIDPSDSPFNIVEFSDDNRGKKSLENYHLAGALSVDFSKQISFGAKADYVTASYAKMKDLRHRNNLLDMSLSAGVIWKLGTNFKLGVNYQYRRRVEGLYFDIYGQTDKSYYSLVDYGVFWGKVEQFGENGYTNEGEEKPLVDNYNGASLQLNWNSDDNWQMLMEFNGDYRSGYYGNKAPSKIVHTIHDGLNLSYRASLSKKSQSQFNRLNWGVEYNYLSNEENLYLYNNVGGITFIDYYGSSDTGNRTKIKADIDYVGYFQMVDNQPIWEIKAGVHYLYSDIIGIIYPYNRSRNLHSGNITLSGDYSIYKDKRSYTFHLGTKFHSGFGEPFIDGSYGTPPASSNMPKSMNLYLMQEYEFLTKSHINPELGFRYSQKINSKGVKIYLSLCYGFTKGFDIEYMRGDMFHNGQISIGCLF